MTIEDEDPLARKPLQGLVPLEPGIESEAKPPQVLGPDQGKNPPDRVGAGERLKKPAGPRGPLLLQSVEAPEPRQEHQENAPDHGGRGMDRKPPPVRQSGKMIRDLIASLGVGEETPEDGLPLLPFFKPLPGCGRDPIQ